MPFGKISLIRLAGPAVCWESTARQLIPFVAFPGSTGRETGKILEKNLIQRAEEFSLRYQVALSPQERVPVSEEAPLDQLEKQLTQLEQEGNELYQTRHQIRDQLEQHQETLSFTRHLIQLDLRFDTLYQCEYLQIRFGRIPVEGFEKLRHLQKSSDFQQSQLYLFCDLDRDQEYVYGVMFTHRSFEEQVDQLFASMGFERIFVPAEFSGNPKEDLPLLEERIRQEKEKMEKAAEGFSRFRQEAEKKLNDLFQGLQYRQRMALLKNYASFREQRFYLTGCLPKKQERLFLKKVSSPEIQIDSYPGTAQLQAPGALPQIPKRKDLCFVPLYPRV